MCVDSTVNDFPSFESKLKAINASIVEYTSSADKAAKEKTELVNRVRRLILSGEEFSGDFAADAAICSSTIRVPEN